MKKMILFFMFFSFANFGFAQEETPSSTEIILKGNVVYTYIENFQAPLAFGIGTEAKINKRFSVGGTINYGGNNSYTRLFVNPNIKFYPKQVFKGFFLTTGVSYHQIKSKIDFVPLGYPFSNDSDSEVNFLTVNFGIGVSTLVKDRWSVGFSLCLAGSTELDTAMIESNFSVGYAF